MANVMMFGFLFLLAVVTQVRAQNATSTVSTANSTSPTANVTSQPTTASNGTSTTSGSKPTNATTVSGTTAQTASNGSKTPTKSATKTNTPSKPTTQTCSVPYRHKNDTDFEPSDDKISHNGENYTITEKSCSNKDKCCAGVGVTTMTLTLKDCDKTTVKGIFCVNIIEPCKCGAGLLSASFLISLLGMLLYFVF